MKRTLNKVELEKLINLRRDIHQHPELGFLEFRTQQKILDYLHSINIDNKDIIKIATTGLLVNLKGKKRYDNLNAKEKTIAFRADIDALKMVEDNPDIDYKSVNGCAHMCGHDGHIACMLGGITLIVKELDNVSDNITIRIMFQPAEEGAGGALKMIEYGCMNNVNEVWGLHNIPWSPTGSIFVKEGAMMAAMKVIKFIVNGKGGHSSQKDVLNDPVLPLCELLSLIEKYLKEEFKEEHNKILVCSFPKIMASNACNVFPDKAEAEGTLRSFSNESINKTMKIIKQCAREIEASRLVKIEIVIMSSAPAVENNSNMTKWLINENKDICKDEKLPINASEDFSEYGLFAPSCFFFLAVGEKSGTSIHCNNYNFNDDVISTASEIWYDIMIKRSKL